MSPNNKKLTADNGKRTDDNGKKTYDYRKKTFLLKKVKSVVAFLPVLMLLKSAVDILQTAGETVLPAVEKLLLRSKSGMEKGATFTSAQALGKPGGFECS